MRTLPRLLAQRIGQEALRKRSKTGQFKDIQTYMVAPVVGMEIWLVHQHRGAAEHHFACVGVEEFKQSGLGARHQAVDVRDLCVGNVQ